MDNVHYETQLRRDTQREVEESESNCFQFLDILKWHLFLWCQSCIFSLQCRKILLKSFWYAVWSYGVEKPQRSLAPQLLCAQYEAQWRISDLGWNIMVFHTVLDWRITAKNYPTILEDHVDICGGPSKYFWATLGYFGLARRCFPSLFNIRGREEDP